MPCPDFNHVIHNEKASHEEAELRIRALEEELKILKGRFEYIAHATHDAVWDWNLEKNVIWWNIGYKTLFGYDEHDAESSPELWYERIHPGDRDRVVQGIHDVIDNGGKNWSDSYRFRKADGSYAEIFDRGYAIHNEHGKPVRMVGSMLDITERRLATRALEENEARLRLAVESTQLGTWDFDPKTGILNWDDRCRELFGLPQGAYIDYSVFLKGLHPDDRDQTHATVENVLQKESGGYYDIEYRTIGIEDKKLRWIRAKGRAYFDDEGTAIRFIGTVLDITDRKKYEQELKASEQRFRLLATTIPQIVWTVDENGTTDFISEQWEVYTGEDPAEAKTSFQKYIHPDDYHKLSKQWAESTAEGKPWKGEYRLKNVKTNEYRWFFGYSLPLKNENGVVEKWIGSATDIHDQKLIEIQLEKRVRERTRQLEALNTRLEKSNEELEQFAYVASHDLQEPLRKIQTFTNMLAVKFGEQVDGTIRSYINKIEASAGRMSDLIKDLLEFSRLSEEDSAFEKTDLNTIVGNVLSDFELAIQKKQITVVKRYLPSIDAIPLQMNQLFHNLIGNAIKFQRDGVAHVIDISAQIVPYAQLSRYDLPTHKEHVALVVKDNGIGFSQVYADQIFTIFQRLNSKSNFEGHGIGLAICRKIVGNHHGVILAEGAENEGATFTAILPVSQY